jgi:hypothetical protein
MYNQGLSGYLPTEQKPSVTKSMTPSPLLKPFGIAHNDNSMGARHLASGMMTSFKEMPLQQMPTNFAGLQMTPLLKPQGGSGLP